MLIHRLMLLLCLVVLMACRGPRGGAGLLDSDNSDPCFAGAMRAVVENSQSLVSHGADFKGQIEFDCREARKIHALDLPVTSATSAEELITGFSADELKPSFLNRSLSILKPYCRSDNEIYGSFCMAADVDSANVVTNNRRMLEALPAAVSSIAGLLDRRESLNLFDAVLPMFSGPRSEAVLLTGFIGLDNNGVQFDRLRANLLYANRFEDYAKIFMISAQYASLGELTKTNDTLKIFFATRTGKATLPGVDRGVTKTYKSYAGFYFGCRLALENEYEFVAKSQAYVIGGSYELLKTRALAGKPWREIKSQVSKYAAAAEETGKKMSAGAAYGYELCSGIR